MQVDFNGTPYSADTPSSAQGSMLTLDKVQYWFSNDRYVEGDNIPPGLCYRNFLFGYVILKNMSCIECFAFRNQAETRNFNYVSALVYLSTKYCRLQPAG